MDADGAEEGVVVVAEVGDRCAFAVPLAVEEDAGGGGAGLGFEAEADLDACGGLEEGLLFEIGEGLDDGDGGRGGGEGRSGLSRWGVLGAGTDGGGDGDGDGDGDEGETRP